jgi:chromosome segregation ATPase
MSSKRKEFNLFENKQLVHIVSEVVVLIGLTFYFSSKNKKLMGHVEELAQRIEDQEDHIQKLENTVQQLSNAMTQAVQRIQSHEGGLTVLSERINSFGAEKQHKSVPVPQRHVKPILKEVKQPVRTTKIQFKKPEKVESESDSDEDLETEQKQPNSRLSQPKTTEKKTDDEELSDSDLDDEISEELAELEEDDSSLKKEN